MMCAVFDPIERTFDPVERTPGPLPPRLSEGWVRDVRLADMMDPTSCETPGWGPPCPPSRSENHAPA